MNFDTGSSENGHKLNAKQPYERTNKKTGFEAAMIRNVRRKRVIESWNLSTSCIQEDSNYDESDPPLQILEENAFEGDIPRFSKENGIIWGSECFEFFHEDLKLPTDSIKRKLKPLLEEFISYEKPNVSWPKIMGRLSWRTFVSTKSLGVLRCEPVHRSREGFRYDDIEISYDGNENERWFAKILGIITISSP